MKYSQFNTVLPYKGKYVLFNSFNQKLIFLETDLKDLLEAARHEGIDGLADVHPTFYEYLKEQEFLVQDGADEVQKVKDLSKSVDENTGSFLLTINPSMNCNFKCWYCYETHVKKSRLSEDIIDRVNTFIRHTAGVSTMKYFSLSFFGGEPLLYFKKDVIPIIDCFVEEGRKHNLQYPISFTTNGYLVNQEFVDYFKSNDLRCALQITLDGYAEQHDEVRFVSARKGSYVEIMDNIRLLARNGFFVRLRVNYTEKNIENAYKIAEDLLDLDDETKKNYILFDFHRVWQNDKVDNVSDLLNKTSDIVRDLGFMVSGKFAANNVRSSCYADKRNSAVINYNGDIFKCTARDFTTVKRAGFINETGELIWENDYLERRMNAKFNNKPCLTCRILPLCNGGCSQHAMEHYGIDDYCVHFGDEGEKNKVILTKIDEIVNAVAV